MSNQSELGIMIDMPIDKFKSELDRQKVNHGTTNNMILLLEAVYNNLRCRKDDVCKLVTSGVKQKDDPETQKALTGLYAEMQKVEDKISILKERQKKFIENGKLTH